MALRAMTDASQPRKKRSQRDIDISTGRTEPNLGWRANITLWCGALILLMLFYYFDLSIWTVLALVPVFLLAFACWVAWFVIYRRGVFTWMRLAAKPSKLMAAGDADGAERACAEA